ncbi:MAG: phospholipid carrier-dependent glycosyltransferase [Terriglobales bacterium]
MVGADEPRYAQIAREMLARRDWVTPVLYGKAWLEKPVLYYWEAMLSYSILGVSDWAARLPSAFDASAMVFAIYFFARRFRPGAEINAALIAASSAGVIGFARGASTDMPLTAAFTIGILFWMAWYFSAPFEGTPAGLRSRSSASRLWLAGFYLFMALGTLAKGPVAPFLAALIIVVFAAMRRDWRLIARTLWLPGILLFLAVALPWYIAVQRSTGVFFREFFLEHNLARFGTNIYRHPQPFWFYIVVVLPIGLVPWTVLAFSAFVEAVRRTIRRLRSAHSYAAEDESADEGGAGLSLFLLLWGALPVIFFSFSGSKLPGYIVPSLPAFAILAADYVRRKLQKADRINRTVLLLHSLVASALLGGALLTQYFVAHVHPPVQAIVLAATATMVMFVAMFLTLRRQGLKLVRLATLTPVIVGLAFTLRVSGPTLDAYLSARPVVREVNRIDQHKATVAGFNISRETEYGLAFYRNRPVPRYERNEIPTEDHLLITRAGSEKDAATLLPGWRLANVGEFAPQRLEFDWIWSHSLPGANPSPGH